MEGIRLSPDSAKSQTYDMYFLFHFLPRCAATFDLLILQLQDLTVHTQWPSSSHSPVSFSLLIRILSSWWYWFDGHNCSLDAIYGRKQKHQQHRLYIFLTYHKERKSKQTNKNPIWWAFNYETICYFPSAPKMSLLWWCGAPMWWYKLAKATACQQQTVGRQTGNPDQGQSAKLGGKKS